MRHLFLSVAVLAGLSLGPTASTALAVTSEDLINLRANGLGDDILVALIESDGSRFELNASDIVALRRRGLSDRVILAMLVTARTPVPTAVPAATIVHVTQTVIHEIAEERVSSIPVFVPVPVYLVPLKPEKAPEPVFWGFGGRPRPDGWSSHQKR
jgi:hypothetical protein